MNSILSELGYDRSIFDRLKRHTDRLRREKKYKELFRDYFVCWCFYYVSQLRKDRLLDRATYMSYLFDFLQYYNNRLFRI
jgi:hypothetical protein